ncbi:MAG: hypothetical protein CME70_02100 [Halobacteriovorax sp.]|nr:hypothetical protein [Halobacteriovorax sp.]|tara:strand:+ start:31608 stop:31979 length:372 start_codon:yes stop_codon:yes gene_type:complete
MDEIEIESEIKKLRDQCDAYLVVLPPDNREALAVVDQIKSQLDKLLDKFEVTQNIGTSNPLSPREQQVLNLIAKGHPNKEIAFQLSISPKTVQFHIKSLFTKLEVGSRTEAVTAALKLGIISL